MPYIEPTIPPSASEPAPVNPSEPTLVKGKKVRVIDSIPTFLLATAVLGPFALPILWRNPRFKRSTKVAASIAVLVFTYFITVTAGDYMKGQIEQFNDMMEQLKTLQGK